MDNTERQKVASQGFLEGILQSMVDNVIAIIMHNPSNKNFTMYEDLEIDNNKNYVVKMKCDLHKENFEIKITIENLSEE